ncbi:hypothetical protein BDL97_20G010700 [Sphagnum fallax]|nr:hypothetical protein BDL97_20G010700 [Sphagnum fallax]
MRCTLNQSSQSVVFSCKEVCQRKLQKSTNCKKRW